MWYKSYKYVTNLTVNENRSAHTSCRCASAARLCGFSRVTQQQQSCANFTMRRHNHDSLERPVVQHASLGSSNDPFPHHQQPKLQGEKNVTSMGKLSVMKIRMCVFLTRDSYQHLVLVWAALRVTCLSTRSHKFVYMSTVETGITAWDTNNWFSLFKPPQRNYYSINVHFYAAFVFLSYFLFNQHFTLTNSWSHISSHYSKTHFHNYSLSNSVWYRQIN